MGKQNEVLSWITPAAACGGAVDDTRDATHDDRAAAPSHQRVWMIADASSEAGARLALAALARGDAVLAAARDAELLDVLLGEDSASLVNVQMDPGSAAQIMLAVRTALARFGRIDILVDAADGDAADAPYYVAPAASGNVLAAMLPAVLPAMREQGLGYIVSLGAPGICAEAAGTSAQLAAHDLTTGLLAREIAAACPEYAACARIADYRDYCTGA